MPSHNGSAAKPYDRAEWLILSAVEDAERRKHMLGSVVPKHAHYYPFDKYSPHWADPDLEEMMEYNGEQATKKEVLRNVMEALWRSKHDFYSDRPQSGDPGTPDVVSEGEDHPVQLEDILAGRIAARTRNMQTMVTDLFNVFVRKSEAEEVEIKSGKVKRYKIDNPGGKVRDNLMKCGPWKEQLQKLFDDTYTQKSPYLLVTGLLICGELEVRWKRDTSSGYDAAAKVDGNAILAALHQPPNPQLARYLDSKFAFDQQKSDAQNVFARCKHDVIFAIRYNYLELDFDRAPDASQPSWIERHIWRVPQPGTIKAAKMGDVVLGKGIMAFAHAHGPQDKGNDSAEGDVAGDEQESSDDGGAERAAAAENWFYSLKSPIDRDGDSNDDSSDARSALSHQNGAVEAPANGSFGIV